MSSSAMAKWVVVSRNNDVGITSYAKPSTIRKSGDKVKCVYKKKTPAEAG